MDMPVRVPQIRKELKTVDDIESLPDGVRAELIDGVVYDMATPGRTHQELVHYFDMTIGNYIVDHNGNCKVYPAPFAVFINKDKWTYLEPDISVICDKDKLDDRGCNGAPDWVIEIVSPSSRQMDYILKLVKYQTSGVREYWIVDPEQRSVIVYDFQDEEGARIYTFDDEISSGIYPDLRIRINDFLG